MAKRNLILFDDQAWAGLLPLTWLKPVAALRIGALTMAERWEKLLTGQSSVVAQDYLAEQFPLAIAKDNYFINASLLPTQDLVSRILTLSQGEALTQNDELLAARLDDKAIISISGQEEESDTIAGYTYEGEATLLRRPYDLFSYNAQVITSDFELICGSRHSATLPETNTVFGEHDVFIEPGVTVQACTFNTTDGPIYIGKNATVMEGCLLRGPLVIGEGAKVKMGAKIYGGTSIGPYCSVGGEISNVVMQAYSNKGHDGFLGNAAIGSWCNIGADTNASNLKNNYANTRVWDYTEERFSESGLQFCGLIMGDHAKSGINTMFNTATVVGLASNVYGAGFPRTFIPDFAWGGASGMVTHRINKVFETAERMMARRGISLTELDKDAIEHVHVLTKKHRSWETLKA